MFSNILVGIDGRQGGHDAVALATQLAAPDAKFSIGHVYGNEWLVGKGATLALAAERRESAQLLADEREHCGLDAELVSYGDAPAARGLHALARQIEADLVVVGSSRHGPVGHVLMGDDARAALTGAPCAIAIAPRGYSAATRHGLLKIGVGYNGTPESESALTAARELAVRHGGRVSALWVVSLEEVEAIDPVPAGWPYAAPRLTEERRAELQQMTGVEAAAVYGGPREELSSFGADLDLLIVGSRGHGARGRAFRRSVSSWLVRHVRCPLLVVPRGTAIDRAAATPARAAEPVPAGS